MQLEHRVRIWETLRRNATHRPSTNHLPHTPHWAGLIDDYAEFLAAGGGPHATIRLRRGQLRYVASQLRPQSPGEIDADDLIAWLARQPWASETRRSYRGALRGFFRWAHGTGRLLDDPAAALPVVRQQAGVPRPAPDEVWQAAAAAAPPRVALMMRLAGEAGLRRGEIARVHAQDLRFDRGAFSLVIHGKGGKQRLIPLANQLGVAVAGAGIAGAGGWLFPRSGGGHLSEEWVGELCAAALPDPWTLHTLRHAFATRAYAVSRDLRAVQLLLGHSSPAVTQRYVAVSDAALRAAMLGAVPQVSAVSL